MAIPPSTKLLGIFAMYVMKLLFLINERYQFNSGSILDTWRRSISKIPNVGAGIIAAEVKKQGLEFKLGIL
jgi:hypothetical protein